MTDSPIIERIEFTAFEIQIENMSADPAGFGISLYAGQVGYPPSFRFAHLYRHGCDW